METYFEVTAILAAGISLAMGLISLLSFFNKGGQKIDLVFTGLCFSVVFYILWPPIGFILVDNAPYETEIMVKRIFNFSFMALLPWFFALYTGFQKRTIPAILMLAAFICYGLMMMATDSTPRFWLLCSMIALAAIFAYGLKGAYILFSAGQKSKGLTLFIAIVVIASFNFFGAFYLYGSNSWNSNWNSVFLPMNLCPIGFIMIMGIQLQWSSNNQLKLENIMLEREKQWKFLLDDIQLVVVKTDLDGRINYINPFGVNLLKYKDESELLTTLWSDHCLTTPDESSAISLLHEPVRIFKNKVLTKDGKGKIINWHSNKLLSDAGAVTGNIHFGTDITNQEEATRQIHELKSELEKENLMLNKGPVSAEIQQEILKHEVIGKSRPFIYTVQKSKQVAPTNASVLLLGETGVGKEAFADLIQATSLRSNMPFVKVNCGALPAELIEDELFGHEKGAFTGAVQSRVGRFEKANGGTIFLDEIGELPLQLQPKLLRVLQNGEFERVGGHQTIKVDVRIIAATNSDLDKEVRENRFREDLFYRLNVFPITIPPLRKRNPDIPLLIQHFIEKKSKEYGKHFENISKADMNRLCDYEWPGNIRELKNVIERAVISSPNDTLRLDWFIRDIENNPQPAASNASLEEMEAAYILKVLQECNWKINGENGAAEKLVMHPNTLRSRMKKLKINVPWKEAVGSR